MTDSLTPTNNNPLSQDPEIQFEENKSYLEELIGPNGKFYDPDRNKALEKLARGKLHSDHYIPILEKGRDQLRADRDEMSKQLLAGQRLQELIDKMSGQQMTNSNSNTPSANDTGTPAVGTNSAVDMNQITSLISDQIQKDRIAREQSNNLTYVKTKLEERYGPNYGTQLDKHYRELGLSPEVADQMARTAPKALEKMLGLDQPVQQQNFQAPPPNSGRRDNLGARANTSAKTWSEWQRIRQNDPKTYYSNKAAAQMEQDYAVLGEAFEDGDFHS